MYTNNKDKDKSKKSEKTSNILSNWEVGNNTSVNIGNVNFTKKYNYIIKGENKEKKSKNDTQTKDINSTTQQKKTIANRAIVYNFKMSENIEEIEIELTQINKIKQMLQNKKIVQLWSSQEHLILINNLEEIVAYQYALSPKNNYDFVYKVDSEEDLNKALIYIYSNHYSQELNNTNNTSIDEYEDTEKILAKIESKKKRLLIIVSGLIKTKLLKYYLNLTDKVHWLLINQNKAKFADNLIDIYKEISINQFKQLIKMVIPIEQDQVIEKNLQTWFNQYIKTDLISVEFLFFLKPGKDLSNENLKNEDRWEKLIEEIINKIVTNFKDPNIVILLIALSLFNECKVINKNLLEYLIPDNNEMLKELLTYLHKNRIIQYSDGKIYLSTLITKNILNKIKYYHEKKQTTQYNFYEIIGTPYNYFFSKQEKSWLTNTQNYIENIITFIKDNFNKNNLHEYKEIDYVLINLFYVKSLKIEMHQEIKLLLYATIEKNIINERIERAHYILKKINIISQCFEFYKSKNINESTNTQIYTIDVDFVRKFAPLVAIISCFKNINNNTFELIKIVIDEVVLDKIIVSDPIKLNIKRAYSIANLYNWNKILAIRYIKESIIDESKIYGDIDNFKEIYINRFVHLYLNLESNKEVNLEKELIFLKKINDKINLPRNKSINIITININLLDYINKNIGLETLKNEIKNVQPNINNIYYYSTIKIFIKIIIEGNIDIQTKHELIINYIQKILHNKQITLPPKLKIELYIINIICKMILGHGEIVNNYQNVTIDNVSKICCELLDYIKTNEKDRFSSFCDIHVTSSLTAYIKKDLSHANSIIASFVNIFLDENDYFFSKLISEYFNKYQITKIIKNNINNYKDLTTGYQAERYLERHAKPKLVSEQLLPIDDHIIKLILNKEINDIIIITGEPGIGKSYFCDNLIYNIRMQNKLNDLFNIIVFNRELPCIFSKDKNSQNLLNYDKLTFIIIDGIEQVAESFEKHINDLIGLLKGKQQIKILITCREEYFIQLYHKLQIEGRISYNLSCFELTRLSSQQRKTLLHLNIFKEKQYGITDNESNINDLNNFFKSIELLPAKLIGNPFYLNKLIGCYYEYYKRESNNIILSISKSMILDKFIFTYVNDKLIIEKIDKLDYTLRIDNILAFLFQIVKQLYLTNKNEFNSETLHISAEILRILPLYKDNKRYKFQHSIIKDYLFSLFFIIYYDLKVNTTLLFSVKKSFSTNELSFIKDVSLTDRKNLNTLTFLVETLKDNLNYLNDNIDKLYKLSVSSANNSLLAATSANAITLLNLLNEKFINIKEIKNMYFSGAIFSRAIIENVTMCNSVFDYANISGIYINSSTINNCSLNNIICNEKGFYSYHNDEVICLDYHPDGKFLISGDNSGSLCITDTTTGNLYLSLEVNEPIRSINTNKHSDSLYLATLTGNVYIYNLTSYNKVSSYSVDNSPCLNTIIYNQRYKKIVCGDSNGYIYTLNFNDNNGKIELVSKNKAHLYSINCLSIHPAEKYLVSASSDSYIKIWDFLTARCIAVYSHHTSPITSIDFSINGNYLASSGRDKVINLYKCNFADSGMLNNIEIVNTLKQHNFPINNLTFSDRYLVSVDSGGHIYIWNFYTTKLYHYFNEKQVGIIDVESNPTSAEIAIGVEDGTIKVLDVNNLIFDINSIDTHHNDSIYNIINYTYDGKQYIFGCSQDGFLTILDINSYEIINKINIDNSPLIDLDISNDGNLVVASYGGYIYISHIRDLFERKKELNFRKINLGETINFCRFCKNIDENILIYSTNSSIFLKNIDTDGITTLPSEHNSSFCAYYFNNFLAFGFENGSFKIFQLKKQNSLLPVNKNNPLEVSLRLNTQIKEPILTLDLQRENDNYNFYIGTNSGSIIKLTLTYASNNFTINKNTTGKIYESQVKSPIYCVKFIKQGCLSYLIFTLKNNIYFFDLYNKKIQQCLSAHTDDIYCFNIINNILISAGADLNYKIWRNEDNKWLLNYSNNQFLFINNCDILFDNQKTYSQPWIVNLLLSKHKTKDNTNYLSNKCNIIGQKCYFGFYAPHLTKSQVLDGYLDNKFSYKYNLFPRITKKEFIISNALHEVEDFLNDNIKDTNDNNFFIATFLANEHEVIDYIKLGNFSKFIDDCQEYHGKPLVKIIGLPLLSENIIHRVKITNMINSIHSKSNIVFIFGESGCGKTQALVKFVYESLNNFNNIIYVAGENSYRIAILKLCAYFDIVFSNTINNYQLFTSLTPLLNKLNKPLVILDNFIGKGCAPYIDFFSKFTRIKFIIVGNSEPDIPVNFSRNSLINVLKFDPAESSNFFSLVNINIANFNLNPHVISFPLAANLFLANFINVFHKKVLLKNFLSVDSYDFPHILIRKNDEFKTIYLLVRAIVKSYMKVEFSNYILQSLFIFSLLPLNNIDLYLPKTLLKIGLNVFDKFIFRLISSVLILRNAEDNFLMHSIIQESLLYLFGYDKVFKYEKLLDSHIIEKIISYYLLKEKSDENINNIFSIFLNCRKYSSGFDVNKILIMSFVNDIKYFKYFVNWLNFGEFSNYLYSFASEKSDIPDAFKAKLLLESASCSYYLGNAEQCLTFSLKLLNLFNLNINPKSHLPDLINLSNITLDSDTLYYCLNACCMISAAYRIMNNSNLSFSFISFCMDLFNKSLLNCRVNKIIILHSKILLNFSAYYFKFLLTKEALDCIEQGIKLLINLPDCDEKSDYLHRLSLYKAQILLSHGIDETKLKIARDIIKHLPFEKFYQRLYLRFLFVESLIDLRSGNSSSSLMIAKLALDIAESLSANEDKIDISNYINNVKKFDNDNKNNSLPVFFLSP